MNFFSNLLGRSPKPKASGIVATDADPFAGQGFVYSETLTSPDGTIRVLNGFSGGEKSATIIEPKVIVAATGRVLFDLWNTYQNCSIRFSNTDSGADLHVQNTHNGLERDVTINFANETFAFKNDQAVWYPLGKLPELVSTF